MCWDNAAAEYWFATLKNEMYYQQSFPTPTMNQREGAEDIQRILLGNLSLRARFVSYRITKGAEQGLGEVGDPGLFISITPGAQPANRQNRLLAAHRHVDECVTRRRRRSWSLAESGRRVP